LTLFLPCMAQLLIMNKERGTKLTLLVAAAVTLVALAAGMTLHLVLTGLGVQL
jgi:ferrous iron transport protein B